MALTKSCLKGIYANNAGMMLDMGRYSFGARQYTECLGWLDKALLEKNHKFDKPEDEFLYAKALHQSGDTVRAETAYKQIIRVHHSMEARYQYGLLLKETGRKEAGGLVGGNRRVLGEGGALGASSRARHGSGVHAQGRRGSQAEARAPGVRGHRVRIANRLPVEGPASGALW